MELLIALLTFFNVSFTVSGSKTSIKWDSALVTRVQNSDQYRDYVAAGGEDLFNKEGKPAISIIIEPVKK